MGADLPNRSSPAVAVVDDDQRIRAALRRALQLEGYDVLEGSDGLEGEALAGRADVMVLDATMPNLGGFELCRRLRATGSRLPILLLTARSTTADRVEGLDAGADDYLAKPFALDELLARLRALLRRSAESSSPEEGERLACAGIVLDTASYEVTCAGKPVTLTHTEHRLLELFLRNPGRVLHRDEIYDTVWGYDASLASNSLEVYVGYLRRKLAAAAAGSDGHSPVQTVRGVGYVLRPA
ncbi:MAG: response regulator transcription factor [Acidimicrobiales bacterium]|nr:response regulator transcription factor [Acidimicrobiales bacterium]MXX42459.1 response regulator transcription factor [Acidimicrobiales bacterium]MYB80145.1 response regulator transcription factor [Acidimicrobiales bacterium]MYD35271.1 response regulator transcription factor [Acidimicrobiales bacterium]MYI07881.1 response regulator transcription factor [Acidimicrobiales bacterium]